MSLQQFADQSGFGKIQIGKELYTFELLDAYTASEVFATLTSIFSPVLMNIIDGVRREEVVLPDESTFFTEIGQLLSQSLSRLDVREVFDKIFYNVSSTSKGRIQDLPNHFKGKLSDFNKLLVAVLKENYGDYFLDLLKTLGFEVHMLTDLLKIFKPEESTDTSQN